MYKYMLIILLIFNVSLRAMDNLIQLPSEQDLKNKLHTLDLDYFLQKTELDKQLAYQRIPLRTIVLKLELAIFDYKQYFPQEPIGSLVYSIFRKRKGVILKAILFNNPDAIKTLKNENIIQF